MLLPCPNAIVQTLLASLNRCLQKNIATSFSVVNPLRRFISVGIFYFIASTAFETLFIFDCRQNCMEEQLAKLREISRMHTDMLKKIQPHLAQLFTQFNEAAEQINFSTDRITQLATLSAELVEAVKKSTENQIQFARISESFLEDYAESVGKLTNESSFEIIERIRKRTADSTPATKLFIVR